MTMKHVVYYDPSYNIDHPNLWELRGHYKYPSIIGKLGQYARITILMHAIPPADDRHRVRLQKEFGVTFQRISAPEPSPGARSALPAILAREIEQSGLNPTVISNLNGRSISLCYATSLAARTVGARYVMRVGGDDIETKRQAGVKLMKDSHAVFRLMQQERMAVEVASSIIVMSKREAMRVARIARRPDKIEVCYRGVDTARFTADAARTGSCRRFLFIGRRSSEKGYDLLEQAARNVYADHPTLAFTFAGTFEPRKEENRHYIGYVKFDDLPALYRDHDAVVVCSRAEGFPQVLMEAMSMGLPCIVSRHLFGTEFDDGRTALFSATEAGELTKRILELASNQDYYHQISKQTLAHAKREFSEIELNQRYISILLGRTLNA